MDNGEGSWDLVQLRQTNFAIQSSVQVRNAGSWGATADWKLAENHVVGASLSYSASHTYAPRTTFASAVGATHTGGPTFTQSVGAIGSATQTGLTTDRHDQTWHGGVKYRHTGKVWRVDASAFYSSATSKARYADKDAFSTAVAVLPNVAIRYDDINIAANRPGPGRINATTAASAPVNVWDVANYQLRTVNDARRSGGAVTSGGQLNLGRHLESALPVALKTGIYLNREVRDNRAPSRQWTFVGPDGIANNADNLVDRYDFIGEQISSEPMPYGLPRVRAISPYKVFDYFKANPGQFVFNDVNAISGRVSASTRITETISAAYVRSDVKLLKNRLLLVGGVRFERTEDEGFGGLNDLRATLRQDANGNLLRDAQGRTIPITADPIRRAELQYTERGAYAKKSYDDYFPSLNASFNLTDSIVARFAYARTIGRPQFVISYLASPRPVRT